MAGIEDFVVEQIMNDFQQQVQVQQQPQGDPNAVFAPSVPPNMTSTQPITTGAANQPSTTAAAQPQHRVDPNFVGNPDSSLAQHANKLYTAAQSAGYNNINPDTGMAWGSYADQAEKERVLSLQKADAARATIMQGLHGLDPQIQAAVMKRLGINVGPVMSKLDQDKALMTHKASLESPHQQLANQIAMMSQARQGQQHEQDLALKQQTAQGEQAGRADSRQISLMRVLAMMMQSDASGKMSQTLGPILMQMMQQSGINLAPPPKPGTKAPTAPAAAGQGFKITRE